MGGEGEKWFLLHCLFAGIVQTCFFNMSVGYLGCLRDGKIIQSTSSQDGRRRARSMEVCCCYYLDTTERS
jgi:hypothetical protein